MKDPYDLLQDEEFSILEGRSLLNHTIFYMKDPRSLKDSILALNHTILHKMKDPRSWKGVGF